MVKLLWGSGIVIVCGYSMVIMHEYMVLIGGGYGTYHILLFIAYQAGIYATYHRRIVGTYHGLIYGTYSGLIYGTYHGLIFGTYNRGYGQHTGYM